MFNNMGLQYERKQVLTVLVMGVLEGFVLGGLGLLAYALFQQSFLQNDNSVA